MRYSGDARWKFAALVFLAGFSTVARTAVLKGPFVLLEQPDTLSIRFELEQAEAAVVLHYGDSGRARLIPDFLRSPRDTFLARVSVDLKSVRALRAYEIWHDGRLISSYEWRSRIDGTLEGYPRLLVFGDSQGGKQITARLGERWRTEQFDLAVGLGDLTDAGSRYESWKDEFFDPLKEFLPHHPLLVVAGNHEPYRERSFGWYDWFFGRTDAHRYFAIDFADLRLIGINNSDVHSKYGVDPIDPLTPQYEFLRDTLMASQSQSRKAVIFCHVPIFSASSVVNQEFGSELQRRYLLPLLERVRVLGFFAGHHHKYERLLRPGLRGQTQFFVSGGAGGKLFTQDRETRGGWEMDREVFEVYHYLLVNFDGPGEVVARSIDGKELDRAAFGSAAPDAAGRGSLAIWKATLASDFTTSTTAPPTNSIRLLPSTMTRAEPRSTTAFYRTQAGFVAVARNLREAGEGDVFTLQGYDPVRRVWGFLQGATLTMQADSVRGSLAIVSVGGTELSPFDRIFPVLHWPVATSRAGVSEKAGSVLWLRGGGSFDFDARPDRALGRWQWGGLPRANVASGQAERQWSVLDVAPEPEAIAGNAAAGLLRMVRNDSLQCWVVRRDGDGPVMATLVHWPDLRLLAIAPGESLAAQRGAIFAPVERTTDITAGSEGGLAGLRVQAPGRPELFIPLGSPVSGTGL